MMGGWVVFTIFTSVESMLYFRKYSSAWESSYASTHGAEKQKNLCTSVHTWPICPLFVLLVSARSIRWILTSRARQTYFPHWHFQGPLTPYLPVCNRTSHSTRQVSLFHVWKNSNARFTKKTFNLNIGAGARGCMTPNLLFWQLSHSISNFRR